MTDTPGYGDARAIANVVMNDYAEGTVDSIRVFTTRYLSALTQTPVNWSLLPIEPPDRGHDIGGGSRSATPMSPTRNGSWEGCCPDMSRR